MKWELTDAYAHVGLPRFGSAGQLLRYLDVKGIHQAVAVLGPLVPDIETLILVNERHPDRLRTIGIPFGETENERAGAVRLQLRAGAMGIRLEFREALDNPQVLNEIGSQGRFAYGIDACRDQQIAELYLEWLSRYPKSRLAAPHFMYANFPHGDPVRSGGNMEELMRHPRFYGILVRNLGMCGSPYPHDEYKAWIDYALTHCGPERLMWGSEYPVLFWRDESAEAAAAMFRELLGACSDEQFLRIAGGNARELFFAESPPDCAAVVVPEWIQRQFPQGRKVMLFPCGLELPTEEYERLLAGYLRSDAFERGAGIADYLLAHWKSSL